MSTSLNKYDVFISFRGEDTRKTFTGQLHRALCNGNIVPYIDYNLEKGDEVWSALTQAIRNSHISVVVFSEKFATSKWCLNELVEILECRKHDGQVVIPVFYEIDPSHVRHQTGSYGEALARHERELKKNKSGKDEVYGWKAALAEAAGISGWDSRDYRDDSQFVQCIVKDVSQKLSLMYPNELKDLVQIDEKCEEIENYLETLPRIGIWGMGGLGKTTIARKMFAKHFAHFDSACFLEGVSEGSENFGLPYMRDKLLSEILKQQITASDVHGLHTFIKRRLSGKKVFIVLDDVDYAGQLDYLCGELDDLGPQSRLIITTRNKHTLNGRVTLIYEVRKWMSEESLELFSLGAFKQYRPKEGYEGLSERAIAYAGGVPLALKVLGSHLHSRSREFWKSELNYLESKEESLDEIQEVLRVSYKGLEVREKEMFLDIAFFFKDENKDFVTRILDACGFNATSGIDILKDKALISISNDSKIQMHDLLQKMAFNVVRYKKGRTSRDPEKRSRLRDIEEIRDVFKHNKGTHNKVEGIVFDLSQKVDLHARADTFNMMTKLKFLKLYVPLGKKRLATLYHPEDIMPFSDKLRYLEWNGCPLKYLPQPFCAKLLVEIRLPHSNVKYLWQGRQELVNLEGIDLSECRQLMKLPDLCGATKLKWLYLSGCESLREVPPVVFSKDTLVTLLLDRCKKLPRLISKTHLTSLEKIDVSGCSSLREFSLSSDSIKGLDLSNTGVKILHPSISRLRKLLWLNLEGLRLQNLPKALSRLRSITKLQLSNCNIVTKSNLEAIFDDGLESLKTLYLKDCCRLFELPTNIRSLSSLCELRLDGSSVKMMPASIKDLSNLEILSLNNCSKLGCLPELPARISELHANNCTSLVTVSTFKTFSIHMNGKDKHISFKNGRKMESDGPSLDRIAEDAILIMKSAALHNVGILKGTPHGTNCDTNCDSAAVCLPGSRVPRQFKYRTTNSSITIGHPHLFDTEGLILSVVVSPSYGVRKHGNIGAKIQCKCYKEDGSKVFASTWYNKTITNLNMDHVFVWYDPNAIYEFGINDKTKVSFEFSVTTDSGERDGFFSMKECGICPLYLREFPTILGMLPTVICTQTQNQELDMNEKWHCSCDCITGV